MPWAWSPHTLLIVDTRQADAELGVHILREARAVESRRRGAAVHIGHALELGGVGDHAGAIGADRGIDRTVIGDGRRAGAAGRGRCAGTADLRRLQAGGFGGGLLGGLALLFGLLGLFLGLFLGRELVSGTFRDSTPPQLSLSSELTDTVSLSRSLRAVFIFGTSEKR